MSRLVSFSDFYRQVFLSEHQHPANIALHVIGTAVSGLLVIIALLGGCPLFALLYPVVHALPGLLGHRLFERNAAVGDVRVMRTDYPAIWFIAGNHRMTWELVTKGYYWRVARNA
jgi:hypothetical protein